MALIFLIFGFYCMLELLSTYLKWILILVVVIIVRRKVIRR